MGPGLRDSATVADDAMDQGPIDTAAAERAGRHGGRYLDATRDKVLRETALELLCEVGYDRLTMDEVAARAHAGKTTIYRRWSGKIELIVDALKHAKGVPEFPDTGSLRGDLEAVVASVIGADDQFDSRVTIGVVNAVARDPELRQVFRERVLEPRMAGMKAVFERAVRRGEISGGQDLELLASVFPALVLQYLLTYGEMPAPDFARRIVNNVILVLATGAPAHVTASPSPHEGAAGASGTMA